MDPHQEATGNAVWLHGQHDRYKGLGEGVPCCLTHSQIVVRGISYAGPVVAAARAIYGGIRQQQIQGDAAGTDDMDAKLRALGGAAAVENHRNRFGPQKWALSAMTKQGRAKLAESSPHIHCPAP